MVLLEAEDRMCEDCFHHWTWKGTHPVGSGVTGVNHCHRMEQHAVVDVPLTVESLQT